MPYTLRQAAQAVGKSKPTVFRAIQAGRLQAFRDGATGGWLIEHADLESVFQIVSRETPGDVANATFHGVSGSFQTVVIASMRREIELLEQANQAAAATIADYRRRLDECEAERRALSNRSPWWRRFGRRQISIGRLSSDSSSSCSGESDGRERPRADNGGQPGAT